MPLCVRPAKYKCQTKVFNHTYIKFPNHPQLAHRKKCDAVLMKSVKTSAGTTVLQPRQIFCYRRISEALQDCIKRPNFIQQCELWRSRKVQVGTLYNGKVWKESDQTPFLSVPYNFALALNIGSNLSRELFMLVVLCTYQF